MTKGDVFSVDYIVSEATYAGFLQVFNDHNPLHTNDDFAKEKGFTGRVMHGNILNGFLSHFVGEVLPDKNVIIHTQQIKFCLPVYLLDNLTLHAEISEEYESVKSFEIKYYFKNETGKKVAKGNLQIGLI